ncbi:hypothetical protein E3Q22_01190 [Wallemia mellicola]|uniref:Mitochondrial carrier n=2 Tax=Wallemia mellicola TaxID=1708541 RepID=A0A4T0Q000_9BASI|nr:mitochondrial carrier [Wallemia mellicola CBS 633.66]TIB76472.1 hypothetical protein E3Q23_01805 [Wallemia mellicola]EIM21362.1 mitochondrial carrier [Wallemia mellicola CBS 633.66]TIB81374.1 hypothetical protein E3Q22_01190 [Wallemia mellicola]TIB93990.1 hypothetical protein E3Q19_00697 [Wallemia mellicola]TIC01903.1 hypothetical protein E3Q18_00565 [Wallemia mellicola]|eukprot:XP_006958709.1 mitochondrial carrier [Wallemia mellicola CBS 633.66]
MDGNSRKNEIIYNNRTVISATSASLISTLAGYPLDSIKSRLQTDRSHRSIVGCAKAVWRQEGIRGFFRGVWIPLWSISAVRATSFSIYTKSRDTLEKKTSITQKTLPETAILGLFSGLPAGFIISMASAPFELIKINRQLEFQISLNRGLVYKDLGTIGTGKDIIRKQGSVRGLYTGLRLHMMRDSFGTGLYFCIYDSLKYITRTDPNHKFNALPPQFSAFFGGALAGIGSWFLVYPVDVVKIVVQQRMLSELSPKSPKEILLHLVRGSNPDLPPRPLLIGIGKLYRGLGVSASRSTLAHGLMWALYESMMGRIEEQHGQTKELSTVRLV